MSKATITSILKGHGMEHYTTNGRLYVVEYSTIQDMSGLLINFRDTTAWSKSDIYKWLGY